MKYLFYLMALVSPIYTFCQVGINTDEPLALFDIKSKGTDNDGLAIPTSFKFPDINPSEDQNGMLIYIEDNSVTPENNYGFNGFYFWDNPNKTWQYIFQSKVLDMNLFKTIVQSNNSQSIGSSNTNTNKWFTTFFNKIDAPDRNSKLVDGELVIGKDGLYSILFNGYVYKLKGTEAATLTEVGLYVNNELIKTSSSSISSADKGDRYTNHTISNILNLKSGDKLAIKTRRTTNVSTNMFYSSNYVLTLSYLNAL